MDSNGLQCKQKNTNNNNSTSFPKGEALIAPFSAEISNIASKPAAQQSTKWYMSHLSTITAGIVSNIPVSQTAEAKNIWELNACMECKEHKAHGSSCFDEPPSLHESTHPGGVGCYTRAKKKKKKLKKNNTASVQFVRLVDKQHRSDRTSRTITTSVLTLNSVFSRKVREHVVNHLLTEDYNLLSQQHQTANRTYTGKYKGYICAGAICDSANKLCLQISWITTPNLMKVNPFCLSVCAIYTVGN